MPCTSSAICSNPGWATTRQTRRRLRSLPDCRSLTAARRALLRHARQPRFSARRRSSAALERRAAAARPADRDALRRSGAGHARRCAVYRRSRLPAPARDGARCRIGSGNSSRCRWRPAARLPAPRGSAVKRTRRRSNMPLPMSMPGAWPPSLRAAGTATLLHGHTHRPAIHPIEVDGRACTRIVLGDWYTQGSVLRWDESGPELTSLPR